MHEHNWPGRTLEQIALWESYHGNRWQVVVDPSGYHRSMPVRDAHMDNNEQVVSGTEGTYAEACKTADELNDVVEVMES